MIPQDIVLSRKGERNIRDTEFARARQEERLMRTSYAQHAMVPDRGGVEMALALAQCGRGVPEGVEVVATLEEALTATLENQAVRREAGIVSSFPAPVLPLDVPLLSVANTVKNIRAIYKAKVAHDTEFDLDGSKRVSGQAGNPARA